MDNDGYDDEEALTMWLGLNQSIEFKSFKDALSRVKVKVKAFGRPDQELAELLDFAMTDNYYVPFDFVLEAWSYYQEDKGLDRLMSMQTKKAAWIIPSRLFVIILTNL